MELLELICRPIGAELETYRTYFDAALQHENVLLDAVLKSIGKRKGKMMRPILLMLVAKNFGRVGHEAYLSAVTLELLHTASLVHDDVVDESDRRRGQRSVNSVFGNKVAVLSGDYLLSTCLRHAAMTGDVRVFDRVARLGQELSDGELEQLANVDNPELSVAVYFHIINNKTAVLFQAAAEIGAMVSGASDEEVKCAGMVGQKIGLCFQIRDDIFDYYPASEIGKPTFNDMHEGKLTLPVLHALNRTQNADMLHVASRVKSGDATDEEIGSLVDFTLQNGGIKYAEEVMKNLQQEILSLLDSFQNPEVREALSAYVSYVVDRQV